MYITSLLYERSCVHRKLLCFGRPEPGKNIYRTKDKENNTEKINDPCPRPYRKKKKGGYKCRPGASGGMPETILEGKRKGGFKSRLGASGRMPETMQKGRRKGGYKSRPGASEGMPATMQKGRRKGDIAKGSPRGGQYIERER